MATVLPLISFFVTVTAALLSIGGALLTLPGNLLIYFYTQGLALWDFIYAQSQNWKFIIVLVSVITFIVCVGPYALNNTSAIMSASDEVIDCGFRPTYEAVAKTLLYQVRVTFTGVLVFWNNWWRAGLDNGKRLYVDLKVTYNCIYRTYDFSQVLDIPYKVMVDFVGPQMYAIFSNPLPSKREVFPNGEWGLHDPMINNNQAFLPNGSVEVANLTRYEFNPNFGAQGPPVSPASRLFMYFPARDYVVTFVNILERAGNFFFRILADLRRPSQLFFPNFYLDVRSRNSYWREGGDLLCISIEYTTQSSFWPWNPINGFQDYRYQYEVYACQAIRIVGCAASRICLVLNDFLTISRPPSINVNCAPSSDSQSLANTILRGIPIIDYFITLFNEPTTLHNLNIFRSNAIFCDYQKAVAELAGEQHSLANYESVLLCPGLALGTFPPTTDIFGPCTRWSGLSAPTEEDRIDYISLLMSCIEDLVLLIVDPTQNNPLERSVVTEVFLLVTNFLNLFITQLIYLFNSFATAFTGNTCRSDLAMQQWVTYLNLDVIAVLEYVFKPDTCAAAIVSAAFVDNAILCAVALASRANVALFNTICNLVDDISFLNLLGLGANYKLNCLRSENAHTLKRNIFASERFGVNGTNEAQRKRAVAADATMAQLTLGQRFHLNAIYYAYETRQAIHASQHCFVDVGPGAPFAPCERGCSAAPCMSAALECMRVSLPPANPYHSLVASESNALLRNVLIGTVSALDAVRGCDDSVLHATQRTINSLVRLARDFFVRYFVAAHRYAPTMDVCMAEAATNFERGLSKTEIERAYLICIGLAAGDAAPPTETWSETLERHGLFRNDTRTTCVQTLHREGLVIDDVVESTSGLDHHHSQYRLCAWQLAFGAAALADRYALTGGRIYNDRRVRLLDYVDSYSAPLALLSSTAHINADNYERAFPGVHHLLPLLPELPFESPLEQRSPRAFISDTYGRFLGTGGAAGAATNNTAPQQQQQPTFDNQVASALFNMHAISSSIYAYVNYLADIYEHAILRTLTGVEKDAVARRLYEQHMVPVGLSSDTIGRVAKQKFADTVMHLQKRAASNNATTTTGVFGGGHVGLRDIFRVFGETLYWVDDLSSMMDHAAASNMSDALVAPQRANGEEAEFFLSLTTRSAGKLGALLVGMRRLRADGVDSMARTGANMMSSEAASVARMQEPFKVTDLRRLAVAIKLYAQQTRHSKRPSDMLLRAQAATALAVYGKLDALLSVPPTGDKNGVSTLMSHFNGETFRMARLVVRVAAAIANNRGRIQAFEPYQSLRVVIDQLTNVDQGDEQLNEWIHNRVGYIPDVGFVSLDAYHNFMALEDETRRFMMRGYFSDVSGDDEQAFYLFPARSASRYIVERAEELRKSRGGGGGNVLDGTTPVQRMHETRKRSSSSRHVTFVQRTANLARYGLHTHDRMLHVAAGPHWLHYHALRNAIIVGNTTAQATITSAAITTTTTSVEQSLDWIFSTLFGTSSSTPFTDFVNNFEEQSNSIAEFLTTDVFANMQSVLDFIRTSGTCRGPNDYRLNGTGTYHFGCLPFFSEHWFEWIKDYPVRDPTMNIWDITQGPGPIQWPPEMVISACPLPRDPQKSCPLDRLVQTALPNNGTIVLVPANGTNFGNFLVNPVLFIEDFCFTDMCKVGDGYNDTAIRPLCGVTPTCDTCPQTYLSALEFGFTDGWKVLAIYDALVRYVFVNFLQQPGGSTGYILFILSFLCIEFPNQIFAWVQSVFPMGPNSNTVAYIVLFACVYGDWFIGEIPQRFVWNFLFVELIGLLSWVACFILAAVYVVFNFGPAILGKQVVPFFNDVVTWMALNLMPGRILVFVLKPYALAVTWLSPIIGTSFTGSAETINAIIAEFEAAFLITSPSFPMTFYALMAFYQVFKLFGYGILYFLIVFIAGGAGTTILFALLFILGQIALIIGAFFIYLLQVRVIRNQRNIAALQQSDGDTQWSLTAQNKKLKALADHLDAITPKAASNVVTQTIAAQFRRIEADVRALIIEDPLPPPPPSRRARLDEEFLEAGHSHSSSSGGGKKNE